MIARVRRAVVRQARTSAARLRTRGWPDHSRLFVLGDALGWSLDEDARYVSAVASASGYRLAPPALARGARRQVVFHTSHFAGLDPRWTGSSHRLGVSYFHGRPGTPGFPEFDRAYEALRRDPARLARVHVTHAELEELVLSAGVAAERVHRIPLGIHLDRFPLVDDERRHAARRAFGLPDPAFVVGSFQKDGVGLGDGLEPKAIKGPDILLAALERVASKVDPLVVLLTGHARGFVRRGLDERGIAYVHRLLPDHAALADAYHALDAYVVASRQEGGPKGVLESLATGIPLVTTRVGQASDLVRDGENGYLADVEDAETLAARLVRVAHDSQSVAGFRAAGRETAEATSNEALAPRWRALLEGFAER